MKPHSAFVAASAILCFGLSALAANAQTSASASAQTSAEPKPVTVLTPMGPHLNDGPSTVVTGTIAGITDKGTAAATENLAGDFKSNPKPTVSAPAKAKAKKAAPKVKGAKVTAKGVVQTLTAQPVTAKPQTSAPAQANASLDAKVQTN